MADLQEKLDRVLTTSRIQRDRSGTITLTVPLGIESKINLEPGFEVEWQIDGERLILTPKLPKRFTIEELAAGITPENRHAYIDTGSPVGEEAW
jgi:antitoxin MazE